MIKVRNALAAGTMVASALIAPVTMPASFASADTVARTTSTTSTLTALQKPCSKHKNPDRCRQRRGACHGHGHGGGGSGGTGAGTSTGSGIGITDDTSPASGGQGGSGAASTTERRYRQPAHGRRLGEPPPMPCHRTSMNSAGPFVVSRQATCAPDRPPSNTAECGEYSERSGGDHEPDVLNEARRGILRSFE
ncbi:hypothetical protein ACFQX6_32975 [Streptosporangium lutulentum]